MTRTYTELLRACEKAEQEVRDNAQCDKHLVVAARKLVASVRVIVGHRSADDPHEIDAVHKALEDVEDLVS